MIEICPDLCVGDQNDYEGNVKFQEGWSVVHACKHPYHRIALGYRGNAAPKNHPEYLFARRDNRLILNMIDAEDPQYIPVELVDAAVDFIAEQLEEGKKVLVHCNQGRSRSPSIGLLYLVSHTNLVPIASLEDAEKVYGEIYPPYSPAMGIRGYMQQYWSKYAKDQEGNLE
ncbi:MAG: dual specificity protein phosphatase [Anaerolineaceae bacterium]|nr:dual specificity protein phosphatase [Anaerolineaceae bacterium]